MNVLPGAQPPASKHRMDLNTHTHAHNCFTALFQDYPGEPVPEEIFWSLC